MIKRRKRIEERPRTATGEPGIIFGLAYPRTRRKQGKGMRGWRRRGRGREGGVGCAETESNELPRQIFSASPVTENVDAAISLASVTRRSNVPRAPLLKPRRAKARFFPCASS